MLSRPRSWIPCGFLLACATATAAGQTVQPGTHVRLRAPEFLVGRYTGSYIGHSSDTLFFRNAKRGSMRLPAGAVTHLQVSAGKSRRRGSLRGALWGGAILGALSGLFSSDTSINTERVALGPYVLRGAVNGAVFGSIVGVFVPARVWHTAEPRILLNDPSGVSDVGAGLSAALPAPRATRFPLEGMTPTVEMTIGTNVSTPKFPGAQFPDLAVSLAVNRASKPTRGAAMVAEFDVIANSGRGLMAGPRVYARNRPLFAGRTTVSYFGQILAGAVLSEESGVVRSRGGFGTQPGAGIDFGAGARALRLQYDHRIVPGGVVEDSRRSPPEIARLSGPRVVVGYTARFLSR